MQIIPEILIGTLFITMFIMYMINPEPEVIIKHPSPDQEKSDVYVDTNNVCYRYYRKEVSLDNKI
jgi:hypothetical protein